MQGSLFIKEPDYLSTVQKELEALGVPKDTVKFKEIENSDILGAIKLVTG